MVRLEDIPNISATIRSRYAVSREGLERLAELIARCDFPKRHLLVKEGGFVGKAYFIERGMLRCYWMVEGEEYTTSFAREGTIVFSMDELYYGKASEEYIEAIEPIVAYAISLDDLRTLFETDIEFANWGRVIHQDEYRRLHRSHKERLTLPAKERYESFAAQFPDVCRRARLTDIASYLGIRPSTLSRIRR